MTIFYLAQPYSADPVEAIKVAHRLVVRAYRARIKLFSPIFYSHQLAGVLPAKYFYDFDLDFICDTRPTLLLCPGWEKSHGCLLEVICARQLGLLIYEIDPEAWPGDFGRIYEVPLEALPNVEFDARRGRWVPAIGPGER